MTHSKRRSFRTLHSATFSALAALLLLGPAVGADEPEEIELQVRRPSDGNYRAPASPIRPEARGLPDRVLVQRPEGDLSELDAAARDEPDKAEARGLGHRTDGRDSRRHDEAEERRHRVESERGRYPVMPEVDRWATRAGRQAAETRMEREGRRVYFRLGFHEGLHTAFDDSERLGRWDHRQGLRAGRTDPEARSTGAAIGRSDAENRAVKRATTRVERQFRDLSREPRFRPDDRLPGLGARLPGLADPDLRSIFADHRWRGDWIESGSGADAGWLDPWALYNESDYYRFYDEDWADVNDALRDWRRRHRDTWRRWSEAERHRFSRRFELAFHHRLAQLWDRARTAYRRGFDEGWDHGAFLVAEWSYRRGYHQGYATALRDAARNSFDNTYPRAFRHHYGLAFDDWSRNAKTEILEARLEDGDHDGVFEPGELVELHYRLANYGGADGRPAVAARGELLDGSPVVRPRVARRSVLDGEPMYLRIRSATPVRSQGRLLVTADGAGPELDFRVAHALELGRDFELLAHHSLSGRATVALEMFNTSRAVARGRWVLWVGSREMRATAADKRLEAVVPGTRLRREFELDHLDTLDLLAGTVVLRAEIHSGDGVLDHRTYRLPKLAVERDNSELVDYLLTVSRGHRRATREEIRRAHGLMIDRLRADWSRAVAADGNPFRRDLQNRSPHRRAETALGELVYEVAAARRSIVDRDVFRSLVPQIETLAGSLPGSHPFLRRSMRRLARELQN